MDFFLSLCIYHHGPVCCMLQFHKYFIDIELSSTYGSKSDYLSWLDIFLCLMPIGIDLALYPFFLNASPTFALEAKGK